MGVVRITTFQAIGQALGAATAHRQNRDVDGLLWNLEGRPPCSCGRQYKRVGWYVRHLDRPPHTTGCPPWQGPPPAGLRTGRWYSRGRRRQFLHLKRLEESA